ncbi:mitochondrial fission ELM1 family protein [Lysobacter sp. S4-A87]|uniref:mitochondrial fission ELM1 family protein n=1 Tax=Lysobacter sp. S4-A87 TaxID=2925843 RepID=UPI001F52E88E|nr:mitochondrial fission ELM1 family protein [Lysobacter sp. S4-A87]UNK50996.1 mitochondrial fission ELM1 family protein [Lysobacter sp. S4-A87]
MNAATATAGASVWSLSDGKAGNRRQADALAHALGQPFREWPLQPRPPWQWLAPRRWPAADHAFGAGFAQALSAPPRLAIGCGRQAALATRLLRERGARAVQILDPRIATHHWDLVIAPEHDHLYGANVITLLGSLHPVDDLWLASARRDFEAFAALPGVRTALLLGGASAHARFDDAMYEQVLAQVESIVRNEGGSVLATASRRTPAPVRQRLRARLSALPGVVWGGEEDGANPYAGVLGWADRIVCTADSVNMLSEAAATWAPVFVAGLDRVDGRPRRFLASLLDRGRIRPLAQALDPYPVTPLRETARVAAQVQARLRV